jgi:signal transduction histidine kinase
MSASVSRRCGASATALNNYSLKTILLRRTSFWRSLLETTLAGTLFALLVFPIAWLLGSPWGEIVGYVLLSYYVFPAWRLAPGTGSLPRRGLRVAAWVFLFTSLTSIIDWVIFKYIPYPGRYLGVSLTDLRLPFGLFYVNNLLFVSSIIVPTRVLIALWSAGRTRLRWQLTFSYLLVGILATLFIPLALVSYFAANSLVMAPPLIESGTAAKRASAALAPLVRRGAAPDEISAQLVGMFDGTTHLPMPDGQEFELEAAPPSFAGVRRMTLLRPDGTVVASAGERAFTAGEPLPAGDAQQSALLLESVRAGSCASARPVEGPVADRAACGILSTGDSLAGWLLVENNIDGSFQLGAEFSRIISIVLTSTNLMLTSTLITVGLILPLALGVGFLLARRLTQRLEKLAAATSDVAAGDLGRQVEVESPDEVGRLGADFNAMATRLQERERALAAAAERAEALLEANRRLVANISHELRTPLATLRGYLEALELDHGEHLPAHDMRVIQGEVHRLTELIDDLFTLARAEAQQLPLVSESVDAGALVSRLVDTLAPLARRERQIEIVAALPDELPLVCADRARLEQVLLNLVQNALRHTPPGGIVAIEGVNDGSTVTLAVADTGVGIEPDELPLVFERFYRSDGSRARETGGAGLGLALVQELVAAMGGSVTAESQPGRGSRFSVSLRRATQLAMAHQHK